MLELLILSFCASTLILASVLNKLILEQFCQSDGMTEGKILEGQQREINLSASSRTDVFVEDSSEESEED